MRFIVDAQLPPALARVLGENGCDAVAVRDVGLRDANDSEIWHYPFKKVRLSSRKMRTLRIAVAQYEVLGRVF